MSRGTANHGYTCMNEVSRIRRSAEKGLAQGKAAFDETTEATAQETRRVQHSAFVALGGFQDYSTRVLEMAQENTAAGLDFAREITSAKTPQEFFQLWNEHARNACETFLEQ